MGVLKIPRADGSWDELYDAGAVRFDTEMKLTAEQKETVRNNIGVSSKLEREIVDSLDSISEPEDNIIYMVKDEDSSDQNSYIEYMYINGNFEIIGNTKVDLTNYVTEDELNDYVTEDKLNNYVTKTDFPPIGKGTGTGAIVENSLATNNLDEVVSASGNYSHAEGRATIAQGNAAHAEGQTTTAYGNAAHAEGRFTYAMGPYSHAEGLINPHDYPDRKKTIGRSTYTMGATKEAAHSEGINNIACGIAAHAEGQECAAIGNLSHAEGNSTIAEGAGAHAEGYQTKAVGNYSHASGWGTITSKEAQTVVGKYNEEDDNALFVVGAGSSDATRKNCFSTGNDDTNNYIIIGEEKLTENRLSQIKSGLRKEIVTKLPPLTEAQENVIYMMFVGLEKVIPTDYYEGGRLYQGETDSYLSVIEDENYDCLFYLTKQNWIYTLTTQVAINDSVFGYEVLGFQFDNRYQPGSAIGRAEITTKQFTTTSNGNGVWLQVNKGERPVLLGQGDGDNYKKYMLINGEFQLVGDTSVDLSNYATKSELLSQPDWEASLDSTSYIANKPNVYKINYADGNSFISDEEKEIYSGTLIGNNTILPLSNNSVRFGGVHKYALMITDNENDYVSALGSGSLAVGASDDAMMETALRANGDHSISGGVGTQAEADSSQAFGVGSHSTIEGQMSIGKFNKEDNNALFIVGNGTDYSDENRSNAFVVDSFGHATLGADPEEDMQAVTKQYLDASWKTNSNIFSNALKGTADGTDAVVITDVSSNTHLIKVKASGGEKVTRYGKNLLKYPYKDGSKTINGVTFTVNDDGTILVNGTATDEAVFNLYNPTVPTQLITCKEADLWLSGCPKGGSQTTFFLFDGWVGMSDTGKGVNLTKGVNRTKSCQIVVKAGTTMNNALFKPQIEVGTTSTAYEPYITPTEYTLNTDGAAEVDSACPSTTIISETEGVTLEATYNRDINKAYAELVNKINELTTVIISLGGNI